MSDRTAIDNAGTDRLSAALAPLAPQQIARALWRGWADYQTEKAIKEGRVDVRAIVRKAADE